MKTKEEIKQLAENCWEGCDGCDANDKYFFIKGFEGAYRQCQQDMADVIKDIYLNAYEDGQNNRFLAKENFINSLNKQD